MDIRYGIEQDIRFEYPDSWDPRNIAQVYIAITAVIDASVLIASDEMTILESVALDGDVAAGDIQITLDADVVPGDVLYLTGGTPERVRVIAFDDTTKTATLADHVYHAHEDSSDVCGCFATYSLDATDTDIFSPGKEITVYFISDDDSGYDNIASNGVIVGVFTEPKRFEAEFSLLYPSVYRIHQASFPIFYEICERKLKRRLKSKGVDFDRVYEPDALADLLLPFAAYIGTLEIASLGEAQTKYWQEYAREEEQILSSPLWVDQNQDLIKGETESAVFDSIVGGRGF